MSIETKLNDLVKRLDSGNFPNRTALLKGYKNLKAFLNCSLSLDLLTQAHRALKRNPFCEQFGLSDDLLKVYEDKVDEAKRADTAIECLLLALEDDLNKDAALDKNENNKDQEDDIFQIFLGDLDELKSLLSCNVVTSKNIEWFLHSDLFCFMTDSLEYFTLVKDIYKALLRNTRIEKREYFMEHKVVLIEKANTAMRGQEAFDRREFFLILNAKKNDFHVRLASSRPSNKNMFIKAKTRKTVTFSPIAQRAIFNHLRRSKLFINKRAALPTNSIDCCMPGVCAHNAARF